MLRLISHSYLVPRPHPEKALCIDLALGLMRAMTPLAERAARLPAGPSNPGLQRRHVVHRAARRRAAAAGRERRRFFIERLHELLDGAPRARAATAMRAWRRPRRSSASSRSAPSAASRGAAKTPRRLGAWQPRAGAGAGAMPRPASGSRAGAAVIEPGNVAPTPRTVDGVDYIEGRDLTLIYEGKKCIHSRFCVTGARRSSSPT